MNNVFTVKFVTSPGKWVRTDIRVCRGFWFVGSLEWLEDYFSLGGLEACGVWCFVSNSSHYLK